MTKVQLTGTGQAGKASGYAALDGNSGLLVPAYLEATQGAAPAVPAAGKTRLYVDTDGLLQLLPSSGGSRRLTTDWGAGTSLPASGMSRGDVYYHNSLFSLMQFVGAGWMQVGDAYVTAAQRAAMTDAMGLHVGFVAYESDTKRRFVYTGSSKWHFAGGVTPAVMVRRTGGYALTVAGWASYYWETTVAPDTTDTTMWAGTAVPANSGRLIAPFDGLWQVTGSIAFGSGTSGGRYVGVRKNNAPGASIYRLFQTATGGAIEVPIAWSGKLAAGEFVEVVYYTDNAVNVPVFGELQPHAEMRWAGNI